LRFQRLKYENLHKIYVKHVNGKLYYQQLHLKYLCNLAGYWLQDPWGWQDRVETCRSVTICEIIVHLLVIVQNILLVNLAEQERTKIWFKKITEKNTNWSLTNCWSFEYF